MFTTSWWTEHDRFVQYYKENPNAPTADTATEREASYLMWIFSHPFGPDLAACSETNS
jgi:hypothetical protein